MPTAAAAAGGALGVAAPAEPDVLAAEPEAAAAAAPETAPGPEAPAAGAGVVPEARRCLPREPPSPEDSLSDDALTESRCERCRRRRGFDGLPPPPCGGGNAQIRAWLLYYTGTLSFM